jgi:hypothetical protein
MAPVDRLTDRWKPIIKEVPAVRFTLRAVFLAVFVVAALCCLFFALPSFWSVGILFVVWLLAPAAMIAGIVYARGYVRAFCIGCVAAGGAVPMLYFYMLATVLASVEIISVYDEYADVKYVYAVLTAAVAVSGLVSMGVCWLSLRRNRRKGSVEPTQPSPYMALHGRFQTFQIDTLPEAEFAVHDLLHAPVAHREAGSADSQAIIWPRDDAASERKTNDR